jgi:hypothetical protein
VLPSRSIHLLILAVYVLATIAKLLRPCGVGAVVAESTLLKHQLVISSRTRAPNLNSFDRFVFGDANQKRDPRQADSDICTVALYACHVQASPEFRTPPLAHHAHPQHAHRRDRHRRGSRRLDAIEEAIRIREPWQREQLAPRRIR